MSDIHNGYGRELLFERHDKKRKTRLHPETNQEEEKTASFSSLCNDGILSPGLPKVSQLPGPCTIMFPTSSNEDAMEWSYYSRDYTMNDGNRVLLTTSPFLRGHEEDDYDDEESSLLMRHLTGETRGQAVLTFMYLCVLGLCFMTAVVYFCRMQWEERYLRRLREHELGAIRSALAQSEATQREESRAVQRKYIEERRARILQLFVPVRMVRFCVDRIEICFVGACLCICSKQSHSCFGFLFAGTRPWNPSILPLMKKRIKVYKKRLIPRCRRERMTKSTRIQL